MRSATTRVRSVWRDPVTQRVEKLVHAARRSEWQIVANPGDAARRLEWQVVADPDHSAWRPECRRVANLGDAARRLVWMARCDTRFPFH